MNPIHQKIEESLDGIEKLAIFAYRKANNKTTGEPPSIVFEDVEKQWNKLYLGDFLKQSQLNLIETIKGEIEKLIKNNSDYNKGVQDVLNLLTNNISTTVDETDRCYLVFEEGERCCTYNHTMGALCLNGWCRYCRNLECVCYQDC